MFQQNIVQVFKNYFIFFLVLVPNRIEFPK